MTGKGIKRALREILQNPDLDAVLAGIRKMPSRQLIGPLMSFFYARNERLKWHAVSAFGAVVADLAETDMEAARDAVRRLMWNLNDESGGIGWGSAEAMGELMARSEVLAQEYVAILISYIRPDGNFIGNRLLQQGILWGIARLAHARPNLFDEEVSHLLLPHLRSGDAVIRALAAYAAGALPAGPTNPLLQLLLDDNATVELFLEGRPVECPVNRLAKAALSGMSRGEHDATTGFLR